MKNNAVDLHEKVNAPELPILLIAFNRPSTLRLQLERVESLEARKVWLFIDGPTTTSSESQRKVVALAEDWANSSHHDFRVSVSSKNFGIHNHFPSIVSRFFAEHSKGIILEDDIAFSQTFIEFCDGVMHKSLATKLWSVCGHNPIAGNKANLHTPNELFYTNIHTIWGWATSAQSIEFYLSYLSAPERRIFSDLEAYIHRATKDPFLQTAIEVVWKKKLLRARREESIGSWDNLWEIAGWASGLPSLMPTSSLSGELNIENEPGHHSNLQNRNRFATGLKTTQALPGVSLDDDPLNYRKHRDIKLMQIWGISRPYSWVYGKRLRRQKEELHF